LTNDSESASIDGSQREKLLEVMMQMAQVRMKAAEHDLNLTNTILDSLRGAFLIIVVVGVMISLAVDVVTLSVDNLSFYISLAILGSSLGLVFGILLIYSLFAIAKYDASSRLKEPYENEAGNPVDSLVQPGDSSLEQFLPDYEKTVSLENSPLEEAVTISPKSSKCYRAKLRNRALLIVEAEADDSIYLSLVNQTGSVERGKYGRNLTIDCNAKRSGICFVCVDNDNETSVEVGITLTVA
jgi:hypothetical protein